jgi:hypothetical protein
MKNNKEKLFTYILADSGKYFDELELKSLKTVKLTKKEVTIKNYAFAVNGSSKIYIKI